MIIENINEKTSFQELYNSVQSITSIKILPVSVDVESPYPVTIQGNTDSGRVMYTKTIPVSIFSNAGISEMFIIGLQNGVNGAQVLLVLERNVDGIVPTGSDVFGAYSPVRLDPTSVARSEYENGGAWTFNLVCEEPAPNVLSNMTDLSAVLDTLNA